jgi:PAS domain S-box-containing protein
MLTPRSSIFHDIVETMREPLLVLDSDLKIVLANQSFIDSFKVTLEETVGNFIYDLGNRQWDIPKLRKLLEGILLKNNTFNNYKIEHEFPNIGNKVMLLNARVFTEEETNSKMILLAIEDVTERMQLQTLLKDSEERYRRLFETANDGILLLGKPAFEIHRANPAITKMLGYTDKECVGKDMRDIGFPDDIGTPEEILQILKKDGIIHYQDIPVQKKNGQVIDTDVYMVDKASLIQCNVRDVTDRNRAEETMLESKARLELATSATNIGHWDWNLLTNEVYFSPLWKSQLGHKDHEVANRFEEWETRLHPDDHDRTIKAVTDYIEGRCSEYAMEFRLRHKDGTYRWIYTRADKQFDDAGRPCRLYGCHIDITERKQAEDALFRSEKNLRETLDATTDGIWTWNFTTGGLLFSPRCYTMLGYKPDSFPASHENWMNLIHPDDREKALAIAEEYLKTKPDLYENVFRLRTRRGDYRWIHARARVVETDENGEAVRMIGNYEDITERKRAEEALRQSEEKYRSLVENINDIIYEIDSNGIITYISTVAEILTGYNQSELIGRNIFDFIHREDLPRIQQQFQKVLSGQLGPSEYRFITKSGETIWIRSSSRPIIREGNPVGLRGVGADITETKKIEAQLHQAQKMESIGTLAGGIAHDFNNILGIILGNTELALDDVPEWNPAQQNLKEVRNACMRAKDLVRQILAFTRKTEQELKPVKIGPLVEEALGLLRASIPTTIEIQQNISAESDTVMADPTQIHQILMNLCTNAAQAMQGTGGVLEIALVDEELSEDEVGKYEGLTPGRYVRVTVSDTGPGIDPSVLDRIFDPYFTTKGLGEGTGMGLSVVQGIVKNHHGSVYIETEVGKGTSFHVLLPITEEEITATESPEEFPTGNERILFVDDEAALAKMGQLILERLGYQVESKTDPAKALEVFRENPDGFDLVITDMTMPQMTGESLARELMATRPDIRILICTGYSRMMDEEKARTLGIRGFIMKPLSTSDMARTVREVLDEQ